MAIFKDNYFTNDSYELRTSRLEILKNYIEYWAAPLAIPRTLVEWGLNANDKWQNSLLISQSKKNQTENIYRDLRDADEKTFKYYLKLKRLLRSTIPDDKTVLRQFGVLDQFPRSRQEKIKKVEKFLKAFQRSIENNESIQIPQNFVSKLEKLFFESQNIAEKIALLKMEKPKGSSSRQMELFKEDSKKLRSLLSWALMTWEPDQAYLVQLGFAVKTKTEKEDSNEEEDN
ncbi:MAG: hypothetical protein B1H06_06460 [Candidatus Cloacimonas sp. 4484_143]|nr:MAG: hypothetical protein B1H06_06460 [Candidatus Cloacimonas sp. 4484_143]